MSPERHLVAALGRGSPDPPWPGRGAEEPSRGLSSGVSSPRQVGHGPAGSAAGGDGQALKHGSPAVGTEGAGVWEGGAALSQGRFQGSGTVGGSALPRITSVSRCSPDGDSTCLLQQSTLSPGGDRGQPPSLWVGGKGPSQAQKAAGCPLRPRTGAAGPHWSLREHEPLLLLGMERHGCRHQAKGAPTRGPPL